MQPKGTNVLVTSIGSKVPLLKEVRLAMKRHGNKYTLLIGSDLNEACIGRHFVDQFISLPPTEELGLDLLLEKCGRHDIGVIIPTRDGELPFFAKYRRELLANGIHVLVSSSEVIRICTDKLEFYLWGSNLGYPVIPTEKALSPRLGRTELWVVKERMGAGSRHLGLALTAEQAASYAVRLRDPVFQPYIEGREYSVDVYVDRNGKVKGGIARRRVVVVNGESQVTESVDHPAMVRLCTDMASKLNSHGHLVFQVLEDREGRLHLVECNARFGGASRLSVRLGLDSFYWFLAEACGISLDDIPFVPPSAGVTMVRHAEDIFI